MISDGNLCNIGIEHVTEAAVTVTRLNCEETVMIDHVAPMDRHEQRRRQKSSTTKNKVLVRDLTVKF